MKFHAIEQSFRKPQTRWKIPKIAALIALAIILSVISIYYPSIGYNTKNISKSPTKFDSSEESLTKLSAHLEQKDEPCHGPDGGSQSCHGRESEEEAQTIPKRDEDQIPTGKEEESEASKPSETEARQVIQKRDVEEPPTSKEQESEASNPSETETREVTQKGNEEEPPIGKEEESEVSKPSETDLQEVTQKRDKEESPTDKEEESDASKLSSETETQEIVQRNEEKPQKLKDEEFEAAKSSEIETRGSQQKESCDLFTGEWVPNPGAPYYTNSCYGIQEHQNCRKHGRPDTEFMKWRWKPDGCELPIFDPHQFLELVRGKSIAFVGDSVARNHIQSLTCLLSRVLYPQEISNSTDENKQWEYKEYNFKMSILWSPYLVRSVEITAPNDTTRSFSLYLDEFDENWRTKIKDYDYVVISAGHWFPRPTMFYENGSLVGCQYCSENINVTRLTSFYSYQRAFRTAFRTINSVNYKGVTFLRTFALSHFENGTWDKGGNCARTRPFRRNETVLTGYGLEFYKIQLEELRIAEEEGRNKGLKFRLFDTTKPMLLRPDGHPSKYGHWPTQNMEMPNDCVHWCLPGPIDTWNDFLLELLKREEAEKSVA